MSLENRPMAASAALGRLLSIVLGLAIGWFGLYWLLNWPVNILAFPVLIFAGFMVIFGSLGFLAAIAALISGGRR